jgi:ClpP class serine protease
MITSFWACELSFLKMYCERHLDFDLIHVDAPTLEKWTAFLEERSPEILTQWGDTARIAITGALQSQSSVMDRIFGLAGTTYSEILTALASVKEDVSIKNVILDIDSPGGTVDGVDSVWQAVRDLRSSGRRVTAINQGLMASAAYWIASAADEIVASSPVSQTGSIGVQYVALDFTEARKQDGVERIKIVSSNAPNKNPDPKTKAGREVYQTQLDAIEQVFLARIAEGRNTTVEAVISNYGGGAVLVASTPDQETATALRAGMIDRVIGDFGKKVDAQVSISNNVDLNVRSEHTTESKIMNLTEFLAANPTAKDEITALEIAARKQGTEDTRARMTQAIAVLSGDFPVSIKKMAETVLAGTEEPAALRGALALHAELAEAQKNAQAKTESTQAGPSPAEQPPALSADGVVRSEEDYKAAVNRARRANGLKEI